MNVIPDSAAIERCLDTVLTIPVLFVLDDEVEGVSNMLEDDWVPVSACKSDLWRA